MKKFNIPAIYKSSFIGQVKELRKISDPRKKDFSPTVLDFGNVQFFLARHFGFCYGVENAIEISYKTIEENPGKRIFLLSQMIHNPEVNRDLIAKGLKFILDTSGKQLINWEELNADDIVIIPAFGTTLKTEEILKEIGIKTENYNTTCPFVKKVWIQSLDEAVSRRSAHRDPRPRVPGRSGTRAAASHGSVRVERTLRPARRLARHRIRYAVGPARIARRHEGHAPRAG